MKTSANNIKNTAIKLKLIFGFFIVSFLIAIVGYIGIKSVDIIIDSFNEIHDDAVPVLNSLTHIKHAWDSAVMETNNYIIFNNSDHQENFNHWMEHLNEERQKIFNRESDDSEMWKEFFSKIDKSQEEIQSINNEITTLRNNNELSSDILQNPQITERIKNAEKILNSVIVEKSNYEQNELNDQKTLLFKTASNASKNILISSVLIILIAILFGLFISTSVSTPFIDLAKEKNKVDTIIKSIGDGVFVLNNNLEIILFNEAISTISGFSAEEAINKSYDRVLKFIIEDANKIGGDFIKNSLTSGQTQKIDRKTLLVNKNNTGIPIAGTASPLKNEQDEVIGCVVVLRDVTKERRVEKSKDEFVALASHQLNSPLAITSWYTETLSDKHTGKLNTIQKKCVEALRIANKRMIELVDSLLNVSRIDLGTLIFKTELINVPTVADKIVKEFGVLAKQKKIKVIKKYEKKITPCKIDLHLLKMIFQNLVSNAIKYTPENGQIEIGIIEQNENILIRISDNGYGIPTSQQSKIFSKMFRADNIIKKEPDGNGLGLYIVKAVVEQSGGSIKFESVEDEGTTFYVTLPLEGKK